MLPTVGASSGSRTGLGEAVVGVSTSEGLRSGEGSKSAEGLRVDGGGINDGPDGSKEAGATLGGAKSLLSLRWRGADGGGGRKGELSLLLEGSATMMVGT